MARHNNNVGKLFELNIISAHDLAAVSKSMRTYAVAWINPDRKLTTRVDENGHANPKWNEKFIFRVDEDVLVSDNSIVMIEIYALTWLRVVLIGTVCFHISTLIPPSSRPKSSKASAVSGGGGGGGGGAASTTRFATLQIRRPSGRPQGTLNIGVAIVNSTMRSMPLQSELTASTITYGGDTPMSNASHDKYPKSNGGQPNLRRSQSETFSDQFSYGNPAGSVINESTLYASPLRFNPKGGGGGSQLGSLVNSDVGPSASVVAAAIAKGLYPRPIDDGGSSILDNWMEEDSVEGLKSKIERWRKETPQGRSRKSKAAGSSMGKALPPVPPRRRHSDGGGLFSCFGNAYGCEFSISCGGSGKKNARYLGSRT